MFSKYKSLPQKNDLEIEWQKWEKRIKAYYEMRWAELFPPKMTVVDAVVEFS
jgi:hypothetical protein